MVKFDSADCDLAAHQSSKANSRSVSNFAKTPSLLHFSGASKGQIKVRSTLWSVSDILIYLSAILSPDILVICQIEILSLLRHRGTTTTTTPQH